MKILPAIDIRGGKCVRLYQGDYGQETIYSGSPVESAQKWEREGARAFHIVDLDGAKEGKPTNFEIIRKIVSSTRLPVQVGGGMRDMFSMYRYIENGVSKIILGTIVLENRNQFEKILGEFADKIIISLDTNGSYLMKKGWREKSGQELIQTIKELESMGVRTIIYTDTIKDGTLTEPNYEAIQRIKESTEMEVIVAGGISSIAQIERLKEMKVDGVILGKALYEGKINLKEANTLW